MTGITREDLKGVHIEATMKPMPNGEVRCRLKTKPALGMQTRAVHATKADRLAWQGQFHRHLHQKEQYLVVQGSIASVSCSFDGDDPTVSGKLHSSGTIVTFYAGVWHDILTTPGSEFVTLQIAESDTDVEGDREVMSEIPEAVTTEKERLFNYLFERH